MRVAGDGVAVEHDGLVVVIGAGVVVDPHHAALVVDVVVVNADDGGVIDVAVVLRVEQAGGAELLVVAVPRADLLHHLLLAPVVVLQVLGLVQAAVPVVLHALDGEVLRRGLVDDEAAPVLLPHGRREVVLVLVNLRADLQVRTTREGVIGHVVNLFRRQRLPVVVATGCILHHLQLAEVGATLEGPLVNEEAEACTLVVVVGVGVLEVHRLQLRAATEGMRGNQAQMGVRTEVANQVVVYLNAVIVVVALLVARDGGDLRIGVAIGVIDNQVGVAVVALERPPPGHAILVADEEVIVAAGQVAVLHAPQRALRLRLGDGDGRYAKARLVAEVPQLVQAVARPRVADEAAGSAVLPVVEGNGGVERRAYPAAVLVVLAPVERHVRLAHELVAATLGDGELTDDEDALVAQLGLRHGRWRKVIGGVAVLYRQLAVVGHADEVAARGDEAVPDQVRGVEQAVPDGDRHVRPADEAAAVRGAAARHCKRVQVAGEGAAVEDERVAAGGGSHQAAVGGVAADGGEDGHGGVAVVEARGLATTENLGDDAARELRAGAHLPGRVQVAEGGTAGAVEGGLGHVRGVVFAARVERQRVAVAVEGAAEGMLVRAHAHAAAVDVMGHAQHLPGIAVAFFHFKPQLRPVGGAADEVGRGLGALAGEIAAAGDGGVDGELKAWALDQGKFVPAAVG